MAITQTYVDPATGNDYKGVSFIDGAFTVADMTLTKTGAFAASKANHWLYLTDNGSGQVTAGAYKIASVTSANAVVLATSPKSGATDPTDVKCTQATGAIGVPWRSVQGALDLITRNATDGDRINVKAGTKDTLAATLSLATYGTPSEAAPLILQGFTSTAGDGGIGEIDGGTSYAIYDYSANGSKVNLWFVDLKIGNCGSASVLRLIGTTMCINCEVHTSTNAAGVYFAGYSENFYGCWFHDLSGAYGINNGGGGLGANLYYCFLDNLGTTASASLGYGSAIGCILRVTGADTSVDGLLFTNGIAWGNSCYCSNANTGRAIYFSGNVVTCFNNLVEGWSGTGGDGVEMGGHAAAFGNGIYNCASPVTLNAAKVNILTTPNDTLASSPYSAGASGNFAPAPGVVGAIEDAFPSLFRGLATTTNKPDKGAVQAGAGTGGGTIFSRIFSGF